MRPRVDVDDGLPGRMEGGSLDAARDEAEETVSNLLSQRGPEDLPTTVGSSVHLLESASKSAEGEGASQVLVE